jgi:hypothetical protein
MMFTVMIDSTAERLGIIQHILTFILYEIFVINMYDDTLIVIKINTIFFQILLYIDK